MDNYIVSARKYRPATFETVVGQKHITSTLKNAIERGQLAHAYLFCGPRGVGKTTCARIFAKAINCTDPKGREVCGECESCRSFNEGRSFNIHELDAASNNSVDDIRNLTDQVRIPPQIGRYSVYIIDEVHMLSSAAFNAFLKTLEEPPAHAVFILATTEKHKILPTILSRCQIYDFNRIRVEDGVEYLRYIASQEEVEADDESLHLISSKADGGMRDALSMFDKAVSFCGKSLRYSEVAQTLNVLDYDTYFSITDKIDEGDYPAVLTIFDSVLKKGFSPQLFSAGLNSHFRDLLMCRNPQTAPLLEVTGSLFKKYSEQAARLSPALLFKAISILTELDGSLRTASSQRLNTELALMKLCCLTEKKNIDLNGAPSTGPQESVLPAQRTPGTSTSVSAPEKTTSQSKPELSSGTTPDAVPDSISTYTTDKASVTGKTTDTISQKGPDKEERIGKTPAATDTSRQKEESDASVITTVIGTPPQTEEVSSAGEQRAGHQGTPEPAFAEEIIPETNIPEITQEQPTAQSPDDVSRIMPNEPQQLPGNSTETAHVKDKSEVVPQSAPESRASIHKMPQTISGAPLASIFNGGTAVNDEDPDSPASTITEESRIDPQCEEKIGRHRDSFLYKLNAERPRIAMAFKKMTVEGNVISLTVPTDTLREEILRNKTEILTLLVDTAGIYGIVELDITVKEVTNLRPLKVEDRLKYLTDKNPLLNLLRQNLDMEIE